MVDVSSQNNSVSINVSSSGNSASINATPDMAMYYSEKSREWAISNRIVDGVDYSSKYYAQKVVESENNVKEIYNTFLEESSSISGEIREVGNEVVNEINSTKTTVLNDIEFVADGEKKEINELADVIKDNADTIINRIGINMFDTIFKDHILTYEESKGLALQGTYVHKTAIAGSRYGYPDFYNKVVEEYNEATETETVNGVTVKVHSNGHKFYNIADKTGIDEFFNTMGTAWFYGVDIENECIFLPRSNYFEQATGDVSEVGLSVEAGLPNITGDAGLNIKRNASGASGAVSIENAKGCVTAETTSQMPYYTSGGTTSSAHPYGLVIDASNSNPIYGNSDTVQPNAVKKLLYICVGNTVSDTSWVDVVTQVKGGVKDLEDKKNASIAEIDANAKSYDNLTKRQITNCLLEVPQRIKYELNEGTLTIKAGSVVIVPYGTEDLTSQYPIGATFLNDNFKVYDTQFEDGKFFVWAELQNDSVDTNTYGGSVAQRTISLAFSEEINSNVSAFVTTSSGNASTTNAYSSYYNTDSNLIGFTKADTTIVYEGAVSFPICLTTTALSGSITNSVDQIFNGMGYIGSTIWVDKGVKGLIPNGRNEDGTLNNIEFTTSKISTTQSSSTGNLGGYLNINSEGVISLWAKNTSTGARYYDYNKNFFYGNGSWHSLCTIAELIISNGAIDTFNTKIGVNILSYADKSEICNWGMPSDKYIDLTLGANGATYTAPANGWFLVSKNINSGQFVRIYSQPKDSTITLMGACASSSFANFNQVIGVPVRKGDKVQINYTATGTTNWLRFRYAEGEV